jgi:hypothetical protein
LLKLDVEGMELEALAGAAKCLKERHPIAVVEALKTDKDRLRTTLEQLDYLVLPQGLNFVAIHKNDKCLNDIKIEDAAT